MASTPLVPRPKFGTDCSKNRATDFEFRVANPAASLRNYWRCEKRSTEFRTISGFGKKAELDQIIVACLGLHLEASTVNAAYTPGQNAAIKLEAINRGNLPVTLREVRFPLSGETVRIDAGLPNGELITKDLSAKIPENTAYSQPYWLRQPGTLGTFTVDDQKLIGLPENPPHLPIEVALEINGQELRFTLDTRYRTVDPIAGELREGGHRPPVFANIANGALVFGSDQAKSVQVRVTAVAGPAKGQLKLAAPDGWRIEPTTVPIDLKGADAEAVVTFTITPPHQFSEGALSAIVSVDDRDYSFGRVRISYPHIGTHILMPRAESRSFDGHQQEGERIGYIPGAGDDVPESLNRLVTA
jgi:hypothetical protein